MVPVSWGNASGSAKVSQKVYLTNFEQPRFCVRIDMNRRLCSTHLSANVDFPWSLKSAVSGWRVMQIVTTLPIWAIIEKFLKGSKKGKRNSQVYMQVSYRITSQGNSSICIRFDASQRDDELKHRSDHFNRGCLRVLCKSRCHKHCITQWSSC